jgi:hypothetical protein
MLFICQPLTLFTTPVIYLYLDRLSERASKWWCSKHHDEEVPDATPAE